MKEKIKVSETTATLIGGIVLFYFLLYAALLGTAIWAIIHIVKKFF